MSELNAGKFTRDIADVVRFDHLSIVFPLGSILMYHLYVAYCYSGVVVYSRLRLQEPRYASACPTLPGRVLLCLGVTYYT